MSEHHQREARRFFRRLALGRAEVEGEGDSFSDRLGVRPGAPCARCGSTRYVHGVWGVGCRRCGAPPPGLSGRSADRIVGP